MKQEEIEGKYGKALNGIGKLFSYRVSVPLF